MGAKATREMISGNQTLTRKGLSRAALLDISLEIERIRIEFTCLKIMQG